MCRSGKFVLKQCFECGRLPILVQYALLILLAELLCLVSQPLQSETTPWGVPSPDFPFSSLQYIAAAPRTLADHKLPSDRGDSFAPGGRSHYLPHRRSSRGELFTCNDTESCSSGSTGNYMASVDNRYESQKGFTLKARPAHPVLRRLVAGM